MLPNQSRKNIGFDKLESYLLGEELPVEVDLAKSEFSETSVLAIEPRDFLAVLPDTLPNSKSKSAKIDS